MHSIHLNNNQFEQFPLVLLNLNHLRFSDLSNNFLDSIPNTIDTLKSLETLLLVKNQIVRPVPATVSKLKKLKTLLLGSNKLTTIPKKLFNMKGFYWNMSDINLVSALCNNPFKSPPMIICEEGLSAVRKYFNL
jgi:hypothetical protein